MPLVNLKTSTPLWKTLLYTSALGLLIGFALPAVKVPGGFPGESVPSTPPDEKYRIRNDAGFSIVFPPEWKTRNEHFASGGGSLGGMGGWIGPLPQQSRRHLLRSRARVLGRHQPDLATDHVPGAACLQVGPFGEALSLLGSSLLPAGWRLVQPVGYRA